MVLSVSFSFPPTNIFVNIFYVDGCIAWSLCSQTAWIWTLSPLRLHYETLDNLPNLTGPRLFHTTCGKHPIMFGRGCHHKAVQRVRWACPLGVHHPGRELKLPWWVCSLSPLYKPSAKSQWQAKRACIFHSCRCWIGWDLDDLCEAGLGFTS